MGNYASPRQASDTIARTATCTDPPFGAVFQTAPTPSHTIVAVLRRRLTLRSRAKAAPRSNLHCKGRMYPQQQRAAGATLGYPSHKIAPLASKMRPPERLRRCRDAAGALPRSERRGRRRCGNARARETAGPRPNPPAGPRSRTQKTNNVRDRDRPPEDDDAGRRGPRPRRRRGPRPRPAAAAAAARARAAAAAAARAAARAAAAAPAAARAPRRARAARTATA